MNKKTIIMIGAAVVGIAVIAAAAVRISRHGKDIIGVTTLGDRNQIIMNVDRDHDFVSGEGYLTIGEGEHIHLEYNMKSGSFDVVVSAGTDEVYSALTETDGQAPENLPAPEELRSFEEKMAATDGAQGQGGIEGKGSLDFKAAPGDYTVAFYPHDAVGRAVVTAGKE